MEATGSYWISLATRLVHEGFRVSVINPSQAHHFAKALLKRAKTDAIDAQTSRSWLWSYNLSRGCHRRRFTMNYSSAWLNVTTCSIYASRSVTSSMRLINTLRSLRRYALGWKAC